MNRGHHIIVIVIAFIVFLVWIASGWETVVTEDPEPEIGAVSTPPTAATPEMPPPLPNCEEGLIKARFEEALDAADPVGFGKGLTCLGRKIYDEEAVIFLADVWHLNPESLEPLRMEKATKMLGDPGFIIQVVAVLSSAAKNNLIYVTNREMRSEALRSLFHKDDSIVAKAITVLGNTDKEDDVQTLLDLAVVRPELVNNIGRALSAMCNDAASLAVDGLIASLEGKEAYWAKKADEVYTDMKSKSQWCEVKW